MFYITSTLFPAKETYLEKAILTMEDSDATDSGIQKHEDSSSVEKGSIKDEKKNVNA